MVELKEKCLGCRFSFHLVLSLQNVKIFYVVLWELFYVVYSFNSVVFSSLAVIF